MGRAIDADALIDYLQIMPVDLGYREVDDIEEYVRSMPTIEPQRKKGKWEIYVISMLDGEGCRCTECGFEGVPYWDYCPNCGAEMTEEKG